jgi:hypothetical protein
VKVVVTKVVVLTAGVELESCVVSAVRLITNGAVSLLKIDETLK